MTLRRLAPLGIVALLTGAGLAAAVGASAGTLQGTTTSTTSSTNTSPPSPTSGQSLKASPSKAKREHGKVTTTLSGKGWGTLGSICGNVVVYAYPSDGDFPSKVGSIGDNNPDSKFKKKLTFKLAKGTWTLSASQQCAQEDGTPAPTGVANTTFKAT